ncbi:MAG: hypothetical protein K2L83_04535 [Muribaculaceae bacterium]|nr:hypothetical protein [Muribaculaceae bacterium]
MSTFKDSIGRLIENNHILEAIAKLRVEIERNPDPRALDKIAYLDSTYRYLLKYLREGQADPMRNRCLNDIKEDLYDLMERVERDRTATDSPQIFYTQTRLARLSNLNFSEALGRFLSADAASSLLDSTSPEYRESLVAKNMALKDIFSIVWTLPVGSSEELEAAGNVASDNDIDFALRGVIVSALILSLLQTYDRARFRTLLSIEERTDCPRLLARVLTGVALVFELHGKRVAADETLTAHLTTVSNELLFYTRMREVIYSLVKARGGVNFLEKMKHDIIPGIRGIAPDFLDQLKDDTGHISLEGIEDNPEWEKIIKSTGIDKKMRYLTNMQSSGADMLLTMFEQISRQPFFNDIDIWFRPYNEWEADRLGIRDDLKPVMQAFSSNPAICDSDKFAMLIHMTNIPPAAREMLRTAFEAQMDQFSEEVKSMMLHSPTPEYAIECYSYARTLYRFFTYFRRRNEFNNPFTRALDFKHWPVVGRMFGETEITAAVAEYYFSQGFYDDAETAYRQLLDEAKPALTDSDDKWRSFCMQKIASCLERKGDEKGALREYEKALEAEPANDWLRKRVVKLSLNLASFSDAAFEAVSRLYEGDPDNERYLEIVSELSLDRELAAPGSQPQVNSYLDKIAYLQPEDPNTLRLLALRELFLRNNRYEALATIRPAVDDAQMYLASSALSDGVGDDEDRDEGALAEEVRMCCMLAIALYINFISDNMQEVVELYRSMRMMPVAKNDLTRISRLIGNEFGHIAGADALEEILRTLPLIDDALSID